MAAIPIIPYNSQFPSKGISNRFMIRCSTNIVSLCFILSGNHCTKNGIGCEVSKQISQKSDYPDTNKRNDKK